MAEKKAEKVEKKVKAPKAKAEKAEAKEVKAEKKATKTEKATEKKAETKKEKAEKAPEVKVEVAVEPTETEAETPKKAKGCAGKVWLAIILTFVITAMLFGVAFFVFMNLEVVDDEGRVRIDHGKIYVDGRRGQCLEETVDGGKSETKTDDTDDKKDETGRTSTGTGELVTNPNARVKVNNATLVEVGDFEVYLPKKFTAARGNGSGKYVYNLTDDSGWADVKIYAEKTTGDLLTYMSKKDSTLKLTNSTYYMNGTSWAEMESETSMAYGTRLGEMIYVVVLNVKLESDATGEAEQMIPKTIRLKRIYK